MAAVHGLSETTFQRYLEIGSYAIRPRSGRPGPTGPAEDRFIVMRTFRSHSQISVDLSPTTCRSRQRYQPAYSSELGLRQDLGFRPSSHRSTPRSWISIRFYRKAFRSIPKIYVPSLGSGFLKCSKSNVLKCSRISGNRTQEAKIT